MDASIQRKVVKSSSDTPGFYERINGEWHKPALQFFMFIVLAHWAEHLAQATQIYILHWPVPEARGVLGIWYPWLIKSESLHYGYALVMLIGIWSLRKGFQGRSHKWWMISFGIQFWHHIEHLLLLGQATLGRNLFHSPVPVSIIQLWIPRVELHLFYNTIVFIPMVIGMYYHMFPPEGEEPSHKCACAVRHESSGTVSA
ncbi:MAG TPA: hypothetical protein VFV58_35810 [Blastocatellia bacterium]|jgi:hypothetical protein|nr:hypothetical protein [Blastocatellia bacterium]